jgi:2-keto-4-pentenoate hydratase/2-oxohepta-3-ene-1,7-dioic acid hydratase in catechol pathway
VGYSTFNDLTSRRAQKLTSQWILGKNGDKSGPLGRWCRPPRSGTCATGCGCRPGSTAPSCRRALPIRCFYTVGDTLAHISRTFTLEPGDLLATGTPAGVGYARAPAWLLQPRDVVEVEVDRLGVLRNTIVDNGYRHRAGAR